MPEEPQQLAMLNELNIGNVCQGVVPEVFDEMVSKVMKNLRDPNTPDEQTNKITLEFLFTAVKGARSQFIVQLKTNLKLAGMEAKHGFGHVVNDNSGTPHAFSYPAEPEQADLFSGKGPIAVAK